MKTPLKELRDLEIPMRDGVILYANLIRPDDGAPHPSLLVRLPYNKDAFAQGNSACFQPAYYAQRGYCVYLVDCRGSGKSQGVSSPDGSNEILDGYDTVEWVAAQPDCDGNVGMYGLSYFGMTTIAAASTRPPHLKAICPFQCSTQRPIYINQGGSFAPGHLRWLYGQAKGELALMDIPEQEKARITREIDFYAPQLTQQCLHVPMVDAPAIHIEGFPYFLNYIKAVDHIDDEAYWHKSGIPYDFADFDVPMLHVTGWYDGCKSATLTNYRLARQRGGSEHMRECQKLIIGPWIHGLGKGSRIGEIDFGPDSSPEGAGLETAMLQWFDRFLKHEDNGAENEPKVRYFLMGANQWREGSLWPLPERRLTPFYLSSRSAANSRFGDGKLLPEWDAADVGCDVLVHNPLDPVLSKPWKGIDNPDPMTEDRSGPLNDFAPLEERNDVLVYTTPARDEAWDVVGEVTLVLYVKVTGEDADFFCRLTDVYPDGRSINLTEGAMRGRYREGMFNEKAMTPGKVYRFDIDLGDIAVRVLPDHSLRLEIASSCYPHADVNMGTFERIGHQSRAAVTWHTVLHDETRQSRLILPLL